ncbi:hypothetical protein DEFDS_P048 (plasmid) [Deferribacter desulfuricans SSM1]|uniref:Uncharacterized protein n=1 Tax=Deferribacter desulfuricans (strain DSM 14783 / JCM 11476 / NBRC 101012 / SSM1) TaxID=639282 RepID=D3PEN0_DEFDS|nr:hypothetical protein [Deferribacter desulfuricans]BAI81672.1 hypothetical protein DEFDS_P048 [Deferribacter desulfuricans SSM1]
MLTVIDKKITSDNLIIADKICTYIDASTHVVRLYNSYSIEFLEDDKVYRDTCFIISGLGSQIACYSDRELVGSFYKINSFIHLGLEILGLYGYDKKEYDKIYTYYKTWRKLKQNTNPLNLGELLYEYYNNKYELESLSWGISSLKRLIEQDVFRVNPNFKCVEFYSDNLLNIKVLKYYSDIIRSVVNVKKNNNNQIKTATSVYKSHYYYFKDHFETIMNKLQMGFFFKDNVLERPRKVNYLIDYIARDFNNRSDSLAKFSNIIGLYAINNYIFNNLGLLGKYILQYINDVKWDKTILDIMKDCRMRNESIFDNDKWYDIYKRKYSVYTKLNKAIRNFIYDNENNIRLVVIKTLNRLNQQNLLNILNIATHTNCCFDDIDYLLISDNNYNNDLDLR